MMRMAFLFFGLIQLSLVVGRPAGESVQNAAALEDRDVPKLPTLSPTISYSTAIESLQSATISILPSITGSILTGLPSGGGFTQNPINGPGATESAKPLCPLETPVVPGPTGPVRPISANIFQPVASGVPAPSLEFRSGHYVKKEHIVDGDVPIQTNKFYANFFLGTQGNPVWSHPYHLVWAKGNGETGSYGMAISHTERSQFAFGPYEAGNKPQYFISPVGIYHMVLSAAELGRDTVLSVEELQAFSVYANLAPSTNARVIMSLPVVQGMGFVTAIYSDARPVIRSGVFFRTFDFVGSDDGTYKWRITLNDNSRWLLYVTPLNSYGVPPFTLVDSSMIAGPPGFIGMVQVAKNPSANVGEQAFDAAAGAYAANATISGSVDGNLGSYTIAWGKGGVQSKTLLMYALPHHVESFDQQTKGALKDIKLVTTTKGYAQAILANKMTMVEPDLPDTIGFAPWAKNPNGGYGGSENVNIGTEALTLVNSAGQSELGQDFIQQTSLNSMYYSGKGLAKFATILYTMSNVVGNRELAASGLVKLKDAFNVFVNNTQPEPLVYDTVWKGAVSSATYTKGDPGLDFGNTLYNDHHFHYGYFVYAAAVIGYLEPSWLDQGSNRAWVNTLVRDYANPVTDEFFPFQRSFDWFHGHSWAKGLFESGDGKDQESTSEDTFATYALKMWGKVTRDANMEARGNLQLAVQARSIRNYFLMQADNKNQPPQFLHNKVTGILFENKIDHTTYFGGNTEYIEGIHMIPLNPSSAYTRPRQFVQEEWDNYFSNGRADQVQGGWKAILYANYALINPQKAYEFFKDPGFSTPLDGGASRTWYLAYTAALASAARGMVEKDKTTQYTGGEAAQRQDDKDVGEEGGNNEKEDAEIVDEGSSDYQDVDESIWPHGWNWPKKTGGQGIPSATKVYNTPAAQEMQRPSPVMENPSPAGDQAASKESLDYSPGAMNPAANTETAKHQTPDVQEYDSPDMSWALQDKDAKDGASEDEWECDDDE
ncbi:endo-1,3(4)-beta-glucanase 1 precursor [Paraphoma chrysanthemicola]|uniref:glucan endo-1,3-beta-D-glucosidase n=1 Tax=Paraphoma chrysanthemicola TaxID=798071 RepID=A0A8K0R0E1_9PLEO|nr:endo-1,3(4)-beta-glucanase 1 precursor [Paraphoma chrysanthemicola]